MNDNKSQASVLGVLMYVYAGIQSLFVLLFIVMMFLYGGMSIISFTNVSGPKSEEMIVMILLLLFYGFLILFGLVSLFLNIKTGRQLRSDIPAKKNLVIATSIINCLGFLCGGICLAPLGIGLGIYGFIFTVSEAGKAYFNGISSIGTPPPLQSYYDNSGNLRRF